MAIVEVKDQYYFYFEIDGDPKFTEGGGDIASFVFEEFAGGSLPMFEFAFTTAKFDILGKINEGTKINCTFGLDRDHTEEMIMIIQKYEYIVQSSHLMRITCKGFIGGTEHLSQTEIKGWKDKNSLDVIKDVAKDNYTVKSEAKTPSDTQNWIRYNIPANRFIQEVWEHSYLDDSNFLMYAINRRGEFFITDHVTATSKESKWEFGNQGEKGVAIHNNYVIRSNHGLLNNLAIYQKERSIFNIETGKSSTVTTAENRPVIASSPKLNIQSSHPKNYGKVRTDHEALHTNYHKAFFNNVSKIALYGSTEVEVHVLAEYLKFELYDMAKFTNLQLDNELQQDTEHLSGLFLITRISRFWSSGQFGTAVTLSKEAMNSLKGELK